MAVSEKAAMDARMATRHQQLRDKWASRGDEEAGSVIEAARAFWEDFGREQRSIQQAVEALLDAAKRAPPAPSAASQPGEPPHKAALDELTQRVRVLQTFISKQTHTLPKYDVKRAISEAEELLAVVERARGLLMPRKKFAFNRRRQQPTNPPPPAAAADGSNSSDGSRGGGGGGDGGDELGGGAGPAAVASANSSAATPPPAASAAAPDFTHSFIGKQGEHLLVAPGELHGPSDYFLKDLDSCVVVLRDPLQALKIENLRHCSIYVGPVAGSIFARNCSHCVIFATARQLRIHDSTECSWFVHAASGPIIEDCHQMKFAPNTLHYAELPAQVVDAGLAGCVGSDHWSRVKDFKWHRAQQSPNWSVLPEPERDHCPPEAVAHLVVNTVAQRPPTPGAEDAAGGGESEDEL